MAFQEWFFRNLLDWFVKHLVTLAVTQKQDDTVLSVVYLNQIYLAPNIIMDC